MNLRKGFSHQFKSKCQISNFLMKKFKYLDLPQYLFINMISYCCKQKFVYIFVEYQYDKKYIWNKCD